MLLLSAAGSAPVRFQAPLRTRKSVAAGRASSPDLSPRPPARSARQGQRPLRLRRPLLIVATDRISAFDYVLGSGIPDKGKVLTQISAFWFDRTRAIVRQSCDVDRSGRLTPSQPRRRPTGCAADRCSSGGPSRCRSNASRAATCPAPAGRTTRATGEVCGIRLPAGLRESDQLPEPIFTPATKAQSGHDINISEAQAAELVGRRVLDRARELTLASVRRRRRPRRVTRHHRRRHEVRVRPASRRRPAGGRSADPDRRSADARLVAVLAARRLPARADRSRASTSSSSATISSGSTGTSSRRCPSLPDDVVAKTRDKYLEAFRRG